MPSEARTRAKAAKPASKRTTKRRGEAALSTICCMCGACLCERWVDRFESFAEARNELGVRERRANDEIDGAEVLCLPHGNVELVAGFFFESEMWTSPTTPTTLRSGLSALTIWPMGSFPGKRKRARVSLRMMTFSEFGRRAR